MDRRERLINKYYSTHYKHFEPSTAEGWRRVVQRLELNFDKVFDNLPRDALICDIACGVGYLEHYLLQKGFTQIHAVDLSEEQIRVAESRLKEYKLEYSGKVTFYINDAFEHLKVNRNYTVIAIIDFLEHLERDRIIEILDLANNALVPGGLLLVRATNADNPLWARHFYQDFTHQVPFTAASLRQCLSIAGFQPIKIDYEIIPLSTKDRLRQVVLWLLGKLIGIHPRAFTEDLIVIARRP